jgi:hypothetical protein
MGIIVLHSAYVSLLMFLLLDKGHLGGHVTAHLYENYVYCSVCFCVAVLEFVFGVLEQRVNPLTLVCVIIM